MLQVFWFVLSFLHHLFYSDMSVTAAEDIEEDTCDFYFGNISREAAEYILWDKGFVDSMFLLRKSNSDYVLSLCYQKR